MAEMKKSGKAALRSIDGIKATGMCLYSIDSKGIEATISVQLPASSGVPEAVLQFGPEKDYLCRQPVGIAGAFRCNEPGIMAVWVLDGDKPVLFGLLGNGPFDRAAARRHLAEIDVRTKREQTQFKVASIAQPADSIPANPIARPVYREPAVKDTAISFLPPGQETVAERPTSTTTVQAQTYGISTAAVSAQKNGATQAQDSQQTPKQTRSAYRPQPLVVKRAPRPTPHAPVYSPLWDDVSVEFEKMLDTLPQVQPFNGNTENAEIVEVPTGGAVQCYIGSVTINGMKVFLQAVPVRPYARPAGFDHSLVSRSGECYWVKYFIQNN